MRSSSSVLKRPSVVDGIVEAVARDIFLGAVEPGGSIAPVRELAVRFGVTAPTAQRALAKLMELGLVDVVHGSGITARSPDSASLSAVPLWLRALEGRPAEARRLAADALELRRDLTARLLRKLHARRGAIDFAPIDAAIDALAAAAPGASADRADIARADLAVVRALLAAVPQAAYATIVAMFERALDASPALRRAMYHRPEENAVRYRAVLAQVRDPSVHLDLDAITTVMEGFDEALLDRYEVLL
jgi:DNA-binding FadR family transcriptional regulator